MTGWLRNVFGSDKANDAQVTATGQAVQGQQEALDYLKSANALPMQYRDEALNMLMGLGNGVKDPKALSELVTQAQGSPLVTNLQGMRAPKEQDALISEAMNSPLYAAIMGTKQDAVDTLARMHSATGSLRSGNAMRNFATESQRVSEDALLKSFGAAQENDRFGIGLDRADRTLQNDALLNSFSAASDYDRYSTGLPLSILTGLAGISGNEGSIASLLQGMGETKAQGTLGQAQTQTSATNNVFNTLLGLGQMVALSDVRLKTNIRSLGIRNGVEWFQWTWNEAANALGLVGDSIGVLAHKILDQFPNAVQVSIGTDKPYLMVDYAQIPEYA